MSRIGARPSKSAFSLPTQSFTPTRVGRDPEIALLLERRQQADRLSNTTGERFSVPERFALRGERALLEKNPASAEQHFRRAIEIAQKQSSRSFELRSTVRLSPLLKSSGRVDEAVSMLTSLRHWFTEGPASRDVMQADRLLVKLRGK